MIATDTQLRAAKPGRHACGKGLYVDVRESGARAFLLRVMVQGKQHERGLGSYPQMQLKDARIKAEEWKESLRAGEQVGPRKTAKPERNVVPTFQEFALEYIALHENTWKSEVHKAQWYSTLRTYVYPAIGKMRLDAITTRHIHDLLAPIWVSKHETARNIRGRVESILGAAKARGHRSGENPAAWKDNLAHSLPSIKRKPKGHAALPYSHTADLVAVLRQREGVAVRALEFTILTACRTSEVIEAQWSEIDLDKAIWTIPAARMKADREHRVPLSPRAIEILNNLPKTRKDYVFPGWSKSHLSNMAMAVTLDRVMKEHFPAMDATVHGFRSTFRDWAGDCTNYSREVCEAALAHALGDDAELAYKRTSFFEKRRELMHEWSAFICGQDPAELIKAQIAALQSQLAKLG